MFVCVPGDLVGLIRSADPSGNPMRWYVDNGRCKGLIASKHLLRDGHNQRPTGAASGSGLPHSAVASATPSASANGGAPRASSSSSTTNRATPVRPTSLTSNGTAASIAPTAPLVASNRHGQTGAPQTTTTTSAGQSNCVATSAGNNAANATNTSAAAASSNAKSFANGNAIYGNIESVTGQAEAAPRASGDSTSLQRQNDRTGRALAAVNGEGVKVRARILHFICSSRGNFSL